MTPLHGLRVVVLADHLADFAGHILARLGAEVLLAEATPLTPARQAAWHRGMTATDADLEDLLGNADVLLDDRRTQARDGLDARASAYPRLVHVVITGWPEGQSPRPVTDLTLMAQSGLMAVTGTPDRPPLRLPGEQAFALTAIQAATAALMALRARRRTGRGQRVTVSALQSAALANYREAVMYEHTGRIGHRLGNRLVRGTSGVRQIWPCADGYVTWSMIDNPSMMRAIVRDMEAEGAAGELADIDWEAILVADTDQAVIERWEAVVAAYFARHDRETLAHLSLDHGWGLSPIQRLAEVPDSPQMQARAMFEDGLPGPLFAVHRGGAA